MSETEAEKTENADDTKNGEAMTLPTGIMAARDSSEPEEEEEEAEEEAEGEEEEEEEEGEGGGMSEADAKLIRMIAALESLEMSDGIFRDLAMLAVTHAVLADPNIKAEDIMPTISQVTGAICHRRKTLQRIDGGAAEAGTE